VVHVFRATKSGSLRSRLARSTVLITCALLLGGVSSCGSASSSSPGRVGESVTPTAGSPIPSTAPNSLDLHVSAVREPSCHLASASFGLAADKEVVALPSDLPCTVVSDVFSVDDFNFDGAVDIGVLNDLPASGRPAYTYWLGTAAGDFRPSEAMNRAGLVDPVFNAHTKLITTNEKVRVDQVVHDTYRWSGAQLAHVRCLVEGIGSAKADQSLCS
jgi:hypothetical protein